MIKAITKLAMLIMISCSLGGCIYRVDVPQGNYLEEDQIALLKIGMTREQVQYILGTPITIDPFRKDRWNYIFLIQEGWNDPVQKNLFVIFKDNRLSEIQGDYHLSSSTEVSETETTINEEAITAIEK